MHWERNKDLVTGGSMLNVLYSVQSRKKKLEKSVTKIFEMTLK